MNRNHVKLIACAAMLCDHMGLLLFPQALFLRYIGRVAMPLFAFFIGEGCLHTRSRKKYLLRLSGMALFCQTVYTVSLLVSGEGFGPASDVWYFDILFTFALSCLGCYALCDLKRALAEGRRREALRSGGLFALWLALACALSFFCWYQRTRRGWALTFDYGLFGLTLPLGAVAFNSPERRRFAFFYLLVWYCFVWTANTPYVWYALFCIPVLLLYNGKSGSPRFKKAFYLFYPAHLGILYLISMAL